MKLINASISLEEYFLTRIKEAQFLNRITLPPEVELYVVSEVLLALTNPTEETIRESIDGRLSMHLRYQEITRLPDPVQRYLALKSFADTSLFRSGIFGDQVEKSGAAVRETRKGKGSEAYFVLSRTSLGSARGQTYFEMGKRFWEISSLLEQISDLNLNTNNSELIRIWN